MLYDYLTEKMLGLQEVKVTNVVENEEGLSIYIEMPHKTHKCPVCGAETKRIHDYRTQQVKDLPIAERPVKLFLRKRRYRCSCGKRFYEDIPFLPKFHRMTNRVYAAIVSKLSNVCSYTSIASEFNLSATTIIRIFDFVSYSAPKKLPEVLAIDEFKGNTGGEKYNCIITDPANRIVLDILPKRYNSYISSYFRAKDRTAVKYFVSDMWKPYADVASTYFKNATQIVDRYHWTRQVNWAFERVRKAEQKKLGSHYRKCFKHSRKLLLKRFDSLDDDAKMRVNAMLAVSPSLSSAHFFKEEFQKIKDFDAPEDKIKRLKQWIQFAEKSGISAFVQCAQAFRSWHSGILSSLAHPYSNGFTEGCNNKIKVLKRNAFGFRNFHRFRNRILHIFNDKKCRE